MNKYELLKTEKSYCPSCNQSLELLLHNEDTSQPAFYICFPCHYIGQIGVGPVQLPDESK